MTKLRGAVAALVLAGCTSHSSGDACIVDGQYKVDSSKTSGSCPPPKTDTGPDTYTFQTSGGQTAVVVSSLNGSCPVTVSGCKATAACSLMVNGAQVGTAQLSLTFDGQGFTGTETVGISIINADAGLPCHDEFSATGTRQ